MIISGQGAGISTQLPNCFQTTPGLQFSSSALSGASSDHLWRPIVFDCSLLTTHGLLLFPTAFYRPLSPTNVCLDHLLVSFVLQQHSPDHILVYYVAQLSPAQLFDNFKLPLDWAYPALFDYLRIGQWDIIINGMS